MQNTFKTLILLLSACCLIGCTYSSGKHTSAQQVARYKHVHAASAEKYNLEGGEDISILASGKDTNNKVSIFDSKLPKGNEAPWHYHEVDYEIFYVVSGKVEFGVDKKQIIAMPGDLVAAAPGVPRRLRALQNSHLIVINTPSGPSEGFIREIANFSKGYIPNVNDRKRFIEKYKIHVM